MEIHSFESANDRLTKIGSGRTITLTTAQLAERFVSREECLATECNGEASRATKGVFSFARKQ